MSEQEIQNLIRLEASNMGLRLWRNNVGVLQDTQRRCIRYGLANDSSAVNAGLKSSDLVGITPVVITSQEVGLTMGIFTSFEIKNPGWVYRGTDRENAQKAWLDLVVKMGGVAAFITSKEDLQCTLKKKDWKIKGGMFSPQRER